MLTEKDKRDVRRSFEWAKYPRQQIRILMELYLAPEEEILDVLALRSKKDAPIERKTQQKKKRKVYDPEIKAAVLQAIRSGKSFRTVATEFGVPHGTVCKWAQKEKKKA